ncbi:MAG: hypothetical protein PHC34_02380 [Candidatus Gastranaerophilales bacterium]|nr:hypothetical protein [Candidatus Gastranaerophilales bacterium]
MKKEKAIFALIIFILSLGLNSNPANAGAKYIEGYNDGFISTYAVVEYNGVKYKTNEHSPKVNSMLWKELDEDGKRKLMNIYYSPNARNADFGSGAREMANWANDVQGWSKLIDALKQKRAAANYGDLKKFYEAGPAIPDYPNVKCTEEALNCPTAKEIQRLRKEIQGNFVAGNMIYKKLVDVKWDQVGVAVKGVSAGLIPVIVDNFMTGFMTGITNGASQMSQFIATIYQFADQTKDFAKNNPNEAAEIIQKLDTLCQMMEKDARTAIDFINKDKQTLISLYTEFARICEEEYNSKEKIKTEKAAAVKSLMHSPTADTGLVITSNAEKTKDREAEIAAKALNLYNSLKSSLSNAVKDAKIEYDEIAATYGVKKNPVPVNCCNGIYPTDVYSQCFKMHYSVNEIREWESDFPRMISEYNEKIQSDKSKLENAIIARNKHAEKIRSVQSRLNELNSKYGKYLYYTSIKDSIEQYIGNYNSLIEKLEKEIPILEIGLKNAESTEKIVKEGLQKRLEREKSNVIPYSSLEANFINSLYQIRDAVINLDKVHGSEEFIIVDKRIHKPTVNQQILKEMRTKLSLLPTKSDRDKEIKAIVDRLKEKQTEENHQIKRLVAGQNNAQYDYQILRDFLLNYTDGQISSTTGFNKVKQDVLEVTGVKLKNPYYDIVEDWQNGDYSLWMIGSGANSRWWLNPDTLRIDMDSIIEQLDGKNKYYNSLNVIFSQINNEKPTLLEMNSGSFAKKFNEYSSKAYKLIQLATNNDEDTDKTKEEYIKILNILSEIQSVIITRERVIRYLPLLKKDIADAKSMLSGINDEYTDYEGMLNKLNNDTKEGSEPYYAKNDPAMAALFQEINSLIPQLKNASFQAAKSKEDQSIKSIQEFYASFKQAYESRNSYQVINLISSEWDAGDGTTLSDLEDYFNDSFGLFDDISYSISNLNIIKISDKKFMANYDVDITGKIYRNNITHKEKSSVNEELIIDDSGKIKINKTVNGRFWYIE